MPLFWSLYKINVQESIGDTWEIGIGRAKVDAEGQCWSPLCFWTPIRSRIRGYCCLKGSSKLQKPGILRVWGRGDSRQPFSLRKILLPSQMGQLASGGVHLGAWGEHSKCSSSPQTVQEEEKYFRLEEVPWVHSVLERIWDRELKWKLVENKWSWKLSQIKSKKFEFQIKRNKWYWKYCPSCEKKRKT